MDKELQNSIDYITQKTGEKSGFLVPKNYFKEFENDVLAHISEEKFSKKKSFDIPTDYFSKLEDEILAKVTSEEKTFTTKEVKVISLRKRLRYIIPYASVASVLLFVGMYFFKEYNSKITFDDITVADIENWYDTSDEAIDNEELAMVLNEENDLNENDFLTTINDNDLEDYLQNTDSNLLNEIQ